VCIEGYVYGVQSVWMGTCVGTVFLGVTVGTGGYVCVRGTVCVLCLWGYRGYRRVRVWVLCLDTVCV
jgi:hypothetical protein